MNGILIDENLPKKLQIPTNLRIQHVVNLGASMQDSQIWTLAKESDLVILTKDADFSNRIAVSDPPPRVVHIRVGNLRTAELNHLIEQLWPRIENHLLNCKLINIYQTHIELTSD